MNCTQLADVAPELALGVLSGRERAEALEHLDGCGSCRHLVSSLSGVTDELLRSFAPSVQPSAGFETRVLAALTPPARAKPRRIPRRATMAVLAAAACVIAVLVGVLVIGRSSTPAFAAAEMRTPAGEIVGWIHVDRHQPATVQMSLPGWANQIQRYGQAGDTYSLRITQRTGVDRVLPVALDGEASWTVTLDIDAGAITAAALIDATGRVWCQAAFD
jgi:hypothetical protein